MAAPTDESGAADAVAERLREEAEASIEGYRAFLSSPAFQHSIDLAVLVKIAGDDTVDVRERRRAAEVLAKLRLQAMEALAELTGTREQSLDRLGLKTGGPAVSMTQVNNRIEIVRASDWRNAPPLEEGEAIVAEVLPAGEPASKGYAKPEDDDAADPAS